ncbi:MAG: hypothetical protein V4556_13555 [Bacteroidota bacterium]
MKKLLTGLVTLFIVSQSFAQDKDVVNHKNSWLKIGPAISLPVGDVSNFSSFAAGVDLNGQLMATRNFGIGLASGYTHYFGKNNIDGFGTVPVGLLLRYYPKAEGFFAGTDAGYTFFTSGNNTGGMYIKPQLGYHNYDWNIYGFYNHIFGKDNNIDVQAVGIAATYNIRFK